jgi:hypothetical protein
MWMTSLSQSPWWTRWLSWSTMRKDGLPKGAALRQLEACSNTVHRRVQRLFRTFNINILIYKQINRSFSQRSKVFTRVKNRNRCAFLDKENPYISGINFWMNKIPKWLKIQFLNFGNFFEILSLLAGTSFYVLKCG